MTNIVIVEDDFHIRNYLKNNIDWDKWGFKIIGEAPDGIRGFELVNALRPEILITDIVMPQMNGIELIKKLNTAGIKLKTVVLSSYDDFNYVKESMKLGADDYILKQSIDPENIIELMKRLREKIQLEDKQNQKLKKVLGLYRDKSEELIWSFISDLISGHFTDRKSFEEKRLQLNLKLEYQNILVISIEIEDILSSSLFKVATDDGLFKFAATNILKEISDDNFNSVSAAFSERKYIIILSFDTLNNMSLIERQVCQVSMSVVECFKKYLNVTSTIGISELHKDLSVIQKAYSESNYALQYKIFKKTGKRIYFRDISAKFGNIDVDQFLLSFSINLNLKKYDKCKDALAMCRSELSERFVRYEKYIETFRNVLTQIARHLSKNNIEFNVIFGSESVPYENIDKFSTVDELIDWMLKLIDKTCIYLSNDNKSYRLEINKAIEYINENYIRSISLKEVAEHAEISYAYLSQTFKQHVGKNFSDYLNDVRVKNAKKLLDGTNLKIYEVADKVGFEDPNYFIRVFKSFTGLTPKEYKLKNT